MEILFLKIMLSSLVICLAAAGIMKFYEFEFEDLPYWFAITTVFSFIASSAVFLISLIGIIWTYL